MYLFRRCSLFIAIQLLNKVEANSDTKYVEVGKTAVLSPGPVTDPSIKTMTWKHGSDIAVELIDNEINPYRQFKGRTHLNNVTGELTITGVTRTESGSYTSEINDKVTTRTTQLLVISPVPKPTVSTRCDQERTSCTLICKGNTTDAEPITYSWKSGDMTRNSTTHYEYIITKEEKEPWFSCALQNPVSYNSSDQTPNPFKPVNSSNRYWIFILVPIAALILCIMFVICRIRASRRGMFRMGQSQQGRDVEGMFEERLTMMPNGQVTSNRDQPVDDQAADLQDNHQDTNNITERSTTVPAVQDTSNQDPASVVTPETSTETEVQETSAQDPTSVVSPETAQDTETTAKSVSSDQETSNQDQPVDPQDNQQTPNQHLTPAVSQDANNVTERSTTVPAVQDTSAQDPASVVSPETSTETEVQETSAQDPTSVMPPETTQDTETPALSVSSDQETSNQDRPVDEQTAGPQDEDQS
ncbi:SLAM family member 5 [Seriola lalandi dorsalis]|uniref:SLAM family member 5 n=1 Tax=Seriola lalandi dorsalis TaxID=1841481 RepID=UPI000C6FC4A3|nr:SLAM family member 5 [Seriola lalandi dorsalis]